MHMVPQRLCLIIYSVSRSMEDIQNNGEHDLVDDPLDFGGGGAESGRKI